jgi:glutamine synthetase
MPYYRDELGQLKERILSSTDVIEKIRNDRILFVDLQFADIQGRMQHVTIPSELLDEDSFTDGIPKLDGSSIRGFTEIHESDMLLCPDSNTYGLLPWTEGSLRTARLICDISWGYKLGRFPKDPRNIAQIDEKEAKNSGFDTSYWGPEIEFFVFDSVSWNVVNPYAEQAYKIESKEAAWNSGTVSGQKNVPIRFKEGYYPASPHDTLQDFRSECVRVLTDHFGIACDAHHHEVATAGQCEIDLRYDKLTSMADAAVTERYVVKNVASKRGMVATLMPKPVFLDNASGMHVHVSLWTGSNNMFFDESDDYAELSQLGRYFGGGLMEHARALAPITNPTTNSYRRLVPGFEAPVYIAWSRRNRSANIRIPVNMKGQKHQAKKRIEYRTPDTASNPYLCFAAMLAAGLDGIKKKIEIGDPVDEDIYKLTPDRRRALGIKELPGTLKEAIECIQSDDSFLKPIFPQELIETIIENGMREYSEIARRPHPYEFYLYLDL